MSTIIMKKILNKAKFILPSLMVILTLFINTGLASATNYPYDYPYTVITDTPPPTAITVTLSATVNPVSYPAQTSTTLVWSTTGSPDTCTGTDGYGSWPGAKDPTSPGTHQELQTSLVPGIYNYKMLCVKGVDVANASVLVLVNDNSVNPTTVTLTASPNPIDSGLSSNLSWTSNNATSCQTGAGPWLSPGSKPINSGSPETTGPLTINTTYEIICTGTNNIPVSALATVYINTPTPPGIRFRATPSIITSGSASSLSWSTTGATSCSTLSGPWINPGTRGTASLGESTGPLTTQTTYGIRCTGPNGSTDAYATVYVTPLDEDPLPPTISYFQPYSCVSGGSKFGSFPKFAWDSTHATSCNITRLTAPTLDQSVGINAQASGGSLEFDGLYYFLTNLPVVGSSSSYRLQCFNGAQVATQYAAVNVCSPDFTLSATPILRSFVNGTNPGTGNPGKIATYTISVNPISGFSSPVDLSIQSNPPMPASTSFTFSANTVNFNGASYETSVLTIGIDLSDFPIAFNSINGKNLTAQVIKGGGGGVGPIDDGGGGAIGFQGAPTVFTPIVVQGVGGGFTHTVTIGADATGKKRPVYIER